MKVSKRHPTIPISLTLSFPVSADVHDAIEALLGEVPLRTSEIVWTADAPRSVGAR